MAITPVSASNSAVTATQALRPPQDADRAQRANSAASERDNGNANTVQQQPPPPKPTINSNGQTVGTLVNVTA